MKNTLNKQHQAHQLYLNQTPVIALGESIYAIADEDTVDELHVAFESFLEGEPIESIIPLQLIYLKALSSYFDREEGPDREVIDEFFLSEGYHLSVAFIHQHQTALAQFIDRWIDPITQEYNVIYDLRIPKSFYNEEEDYSFCSNNDSIEVNRMMYEFNIPSTYRGLRAANQLFVLAEHYEALIQDLNQIFK